MDTLNKLREILLAVFVLENIEQIQPEASLVNDIGADSLDFVEIVYSIEKNFGVKIRTSELIGGNEEDLFKDGLLSEAGFTKICTIFPHAEQRFRAGMNKPEIFSQLKVSDLAVIIDIKLKEKNS